VHFVQTYMRSFRNFVGFCKSTLTLWFWLIVLVLVKVGQSNDNPHFIFEIILNENNITTKSDLLSKDYVYSQSNNRQPIDTQTADRLSVPYSILLWWLRKIHGKVLAFLIIPGTVFS